MHFKPQLVDLRSEQNLNQTLTTATMFPGGPGKCSEDHQCRQSVGVSSSLPAHHLSSSSGRNPWQSTSLPARSLFAADQKKKSGTVDGGAVQTAVVDTSRSQTHTLLSWSRALSICSSWAIFCLVADAWLFPFGSWDSSGRRWPTDERTRGTQQE